MLHILRQFQRRLAGTFAVLVGSAWLMLAAGPCVAAIQAEDAHDCPHCDHVEMPCATIDTGDCELPPALAANNEFKLKLEMPLAVTELPVVQQPARLSEPPSRPCATGPPHPPFTQLFCRFQE